MRGGDAAYEMEWAVHPRLAGSFAIQGVEDPLRRDGQLQNGNSDRVRHGIGDGTGGWDDRYLPDRLGAERARPRGAAQIDGGQLGHVPDARHLVVGQVAVVDPAFFG